jgi:DGQHR domain-containing protein
VVRLGRDMINEEPRSVEFPVMRVSQPIGDFYVGKISAKDLIDISWFDVRRLKGDDDLDDYLGVQRKVSPKRVEEIARYVRLPDASFPTAVVLAVEGRSVELTKICEEDVPGIFYRMRLTNNPGGFDEADTVLFRGIARVLDGQHRIRGLQASDIDKHNFDVNVCIFVDADIADQASIFATVNIAQTKVNRSLVYDLLSYSTSRSPERTCHTVTVLLDQTEKSPFFRRIKRLGVATEGRFGEVITQATVVKALLPYITDDVLRDREIGKTTGFWRAAGHFNPDKLIFRDWFVEEQDGLIADQLMHYFEAVRRKWPDQWDNPPQGNILVRTNGFRAFMALLRPMYNHLKSHSGAFVKMTEFSEMFEPISIDGEKINSKNYLPGSSGERALFKDLLDSSGLSDYA